MGLYFRKASEPKQGLNIEVQAIVKVLDRITAGIESAVSKMEGVADREAIAERITLLEATLDRRIGEAAGDLIEAKNVLRLSKNAEQRGRDRAATQSDNGAPEIGAEQLEELVTELRRELLSGDGRGSEGHRVPAMRAEVDDFYDEEGYE